MSTENDNLFSDVSFEDVADFLDNTMADVEQTPDVPEMDTDTPEVNDSVIQELSDEDPVDLDGFDNINTSEGASLENVAGESQESASSAPSSPSSPSSVYHALASALHQEGALPSFDPEKQKVEDVEGLISAIQNEIRNQELAHLTDRQKRVLKAFETGIPEEEIVSYEKSIDDLSSISDDEIKENVELRQTIITEAYKAQGMSADKAQKLAKRAFDAGEDLEEAMESHQFLKQQMEAEYENRLKMEQEQRRQYEAEAKQRIEDIKKTVFDEKNEIIKGAPVTKNIRTKVYESMTNVAGHDEQGRPYNQIMQARMEDPTKFEIALHTAFVLTNGFKDMSKLVQKSKSDAVSELDKTLRSGVLDFGIGSPASSTDPGAPNDPNFGKELEELARNLLG